MPARKPRRRAGERIERVAGARGLVVSAVAMSARSSTGDAHGQGVPHQGARGRRADPRLPPDRRAVDERPPSHPSKEAPDKDVHRIVIPDRRFDGLGRGPRNLASIVCAQARAARRTHQVGAVVARAGGGVTTAVCQRATPSSDTRSYCSSLANESAGRSGGTTPLRTRCQPQTGRPPRLADGRCCSITWQASGTSSSSTRG
jgi:hypothetical protein